MVTDSRATVRADRLRPLNLPRPIQVDAGGGSPVRVGGWAVEILDRWRIDDEWWRPASISRMYFRVVLDGGQVLTIFHDLIEGGWYLQTAATPRPTLGEPALAQVPRRGRSNGSG